MASVTNDSSSSNVADGELQAKSIPTVDLRLLSQSELYSLSLCSTTDYNPCRDDDFIIPKIDRSVFNESAASRKQTYSRIPYAPPLPPPVAVHLILHLLTMAQRILKSLTILNSYSGILPIQYLIRLIIPIPYLLPRIMCLNRPMWVQFGRKRIEEWQGE
ncbi:hypothetical protein H5410_023930 [Solanum commersonii]|uniref:Uncharacterized protein n=1 Tax=Solanum commersonii TaxID=4109 RepID=A0A9J5ZKJ5_SOLCO|nr:hypothetical protein H5410_023930 [Solanum commersonii]